MQEILLGLDIKYGSLSGTNWQHLLMMHRQEQHYGKFNLQKVNQKLRIILFPACMFTCMLLSLQEVCKHITADL